MRTQKQLYPQISNVYKCELKTCLICGSRLEQSDYLNGRKIVQTVSSVISNSRFEVKMDYGLSLDSDIVYNKDEPKG